ncbi:MAG: peptide chain release factor N(5)-glutamine methyltransferase [Candidatus Moranbacteria bacterium]|nr:peptide chain release factor N(5)-glutamine methyltransferase [Candidatus Moranbacteria bacterium]
MSTKNTISSLLCELRQTPDCEQIVAHVLDVSHVFLIAHPEKNVSSGDVQRIFDLCQRRLRGEPLAYLVGSKEFFGRDFFVNSSVLIPRPDTEVLVERVLDDLGKTNNTQSILIADVGTGSGAIGVTLACETSEKFSDRTISFLASDISHEALLVAQQNAQQHNVFDHIDFSHGDLLAPLVTHISSGNNSFDTLLIVANLPYVDNVSRETLLAKKESQALSFEPGLALWSEEKGLAHYRRFFLQLSSLPSFFHAHTIVCYCEISPEQEMDFSAFVASFFPNVTTMFVSDYSGRTRVGVVVYR